MAWADRAFDPSELERPGLMPADAEGRLEHQGARIWYASYGSGAPVILLHGGLGNSEDWSNQVGPLVESGRRVVLVDSRGHGRSTRDGRPLRYELMAADIAKLIDDLDLEHPAVAGWSDGAIIALTLAMTAPQRIARAFAFGVNMDLGGVKALPPDDSRVAFVFQRLTADYARLSETPHDFAAFAQAVNTMMATQPDYRAADLQTIRVPVAIVYAEHDEFIKREHADYLARTIPTAELIELAGVSHFAPLQKPELFNAALLAFLETGLHL